MKQIAIAAALFVIAVAAGLAVRGYKAARDRHAAAEFSAECTALLHGIDTQGGLRDNATELGRCVVLGGISQDDLRAKVADIIRPPVLRNGVWVKD